MRPIAAAVLLALVAGCSSGATTTAPAPIPPTARTAAPAAPPACAWYTPLATPGQVVSVTATGPACTDRSLIDWLASDTDRPWTSESVIPGADGQPVATLTRNGSRVQVWFTGPPVVHVSPPAASPQATLSAPPAAALAGQLADALMASGWSPVPGG